jgi:hypothetical protein
MNVHEVTVRLYRVTLIVILLVASIAPLAAQTPVAEQPGRNKPQPATGVHLGPVPLALQAHLPSLEPGQGVLVEDIQANCSLAQAGVARFDILLALDGARLRDGLHFSELLAEARIGQKRRLELLRGGKSMVLSFLQAEFDPNRVPKGILKAGGPPAVSVEAQPLEPGKLKVVLVFYSPKGKLERVTCSGSMVQIEAEVRQLGEQQRMPPRVQDLVDVALKRIRILNPSEHR